MLFRSESAQSNTHAVFDTSAESAFQGDFSIPTSSQTRITSIQLSNESGIAVDPAAMLENPISIKATQEGAQVIIYHTHATEAYTPSGNDTYTAISQERTTNNNQNVVRIGAELAYVLEQRGISVIHVTEQFDYPAYNGSYGRSLPAIQQLLKENPSVCVTIDVHRDAVLDDNGDPLATTVLIDGQPYAPMMLVVGTNASGLQHDNWKQNFNFAVDRKSVV